MGNRVEEEKKKKRKKEEEEEGGGKLKPGYYRYNASPKPKYFILCNPFNKNTASSTGFVLLSAGIAIIKMLSACLTLEYT